MTNCFHGWHLTDIYDCLFDCCLISLPYLGLHNAQDFVQILYFVGGVRIINRNNVFHSFPDREIACPPIKPNTFNILQLYWRWRDKWFLNSPSKWNMLKGLKNIYDWYLLLTFPTAIFLKVHAHYRVFFWRFSRPRGGAHYAPMRIIQP